MPQQFPFLVTSSGQIATTPVELALALGLAMQKRDETGIPFVRRSEEIPTAISRVTWPILMRRAFAADRVLFFDLTGILGEKMVIPVQPEFTLSPDHLKLHEDDSFNNDLLRLAQIYAELAPTSLASHMVTLFSGLGDTLQRDRALPEATNWGSSIPVSEEHVRQVLDEQEALVSWMTHFNEEEGKLDQILKELREISGRRMEYYEWQKNKALQLLNEEISTLEPQVNQQIGDLKKQYEMMQQQKSALQLRTAEMEAQVGQLQGEQQKYQGRSQQMFDYYAERIRKTREEIHRLSEQEARNDEEALEEMSARSLLLRKPLAILEQQRQQAERLWQQTINAERELIKTLTAILQQAQQDFGLAAKELLNRSQVMATDIPDEMRLELPFIIVRMQSVTGSRYMILPPALLKPAGQISNFLTGLVGGIRLPLSSRGATWEEMAKLIEEHLNREPLPSWLYEVLQNNDLLRNDTCWNLLTEGVEQLKTGGYLPERMAEQLAQQIGKVKEARTLSEDDIETKSEPPIESTPE